MLRVWQPPPATPAVGAQAGGQGLCPGWGTWHQPWSWECTRDTHTHTPPHTQTGHRLRLCREMVKKRFHEVDWPSTKTRENTATVARHYLLQLTLQIQFFTCGFGCTNRTRIDISSSVSRIAAPGWTNQQPEVTGSSLGLWWHWKSPAALLHSTP